MSDRFEELAHHEHARWADWQRYLHSLCVKNPDGSLTIPADRVERWERQIGTDYAELTEGEKESDREQVRRYIHLVASMDQLNAAYAERDRLAALLSKVFPAHLVEATDKSPGWHYVVIIDLPTGQISFHVSDAEASELFDHLEFRDNDWDSHSNEEKWQRVLAMPPHPTPKTIVNSFRWHQAHRTREVEHDGV